MNNQKTRVVGFHHGLVVFMGVVDAVWRGEDGCNGPEQPDADLLISYIYIYIYIYGIASMMCGGRVGSGYKARRRRWRKSNKSFWMVMKRQMS